MATNQDKVKELIDLRNQAKLGGGEKRIESQHKRVNIQPGKESPCCWTKTASKNSICSSHTGVTISAWKRQNSSETELLPDKERSTDVSYLYLHRILPYSEEHFQKCGQKICKVMDKAMTVGAPIIGLNDSRWCTYSGRRKFIGRIC